MLPLISFETGRRTLTQSSGQPDRLRQQMEVWFFLGKKKLRLRGQHARRRNRKNLHPRSSGARRESFCPLDKDLSWKSRYRTSALRARVRRKTRAASFKRLRFH
jgi:hypothetical protein